MCIRSVEELRLHATVFDPRRAISSLCGSPLSCGFEDSKPCASNITPQSSIRGPLRLTASAVDHQNTRSAGAAASCSQSTPCQPARRKAMPLPASCSARPNNRKTSQSVLFKVRLELQELGFGTPSNIVVILHLLWSFISGFNIRQGLLFSRHARNPVNTINRNLTP